MGAIRSHRDLIVWQKSMDLTVQIYRHVKVFPAREIYCLTSQITRAASSVPANIAEGHARSTAKEFAHFLSIAKGFLMETETFLMLAVRLDYLSSHETSEAMALVSDISKMLTSLRTKVRARAARPKGPAK